MKTGFGLAVGRKLSQTTVVTWMAVLLVVLMGMSGCGGDDSDPTSPAITSTGATLHAVLCIADHEADIGAAGNVDSNNIANWLGQISQNTGMPLSTTVIRGTSGTLTRSFLMNTLNNLAVGGDDVVVFYYSGHGGANEYAGGSRWPLLIFLDEEEVDLAEVNTTIQARGARFVLTMADCCNNFASQAKLAPLVPRGTHDNYSALFLSQQGHLYLSAASPGEFSLGDSEEGGMFTQQFLQSFYANVESGSASWSTIVEQATQELRAADENGEETIFHPQHDLAI